MVDGAEVGGVKWGQSRLVQVAPGRHEVHIEGAGSRSPSVEIDVAPGGKATLVCWSKFQAWQWQTALANPNEIIALAHTAGVGDVAVAVPPVTAAEQPTSLAVPLPSRSFAPLVLSFACAVLLVVAWHVTGVSALGSAAWLAWAVTIAISVLNARHYGAYRRELRALGRQLKREKADRN